MLHGRALHHIALLVQDLSRAEAFYVGVLGLRVARRWNDAHGELRSIWLALGRDGLLMLERGAPRAQEGGWHLVALRIQADERDGMEEALRGHGVEITNKSAYTLYFQDPEGNHLGLSHWPDPAP